MVVIIVMVIMVMVIMVMVIIMVVLTLFILMCCYGLMYVHTAMPYSYSP